MEKKIEYPKTNKITNKKLKKCNPNKWMKLGITTLIIEIIIKNKVLATTDPNSLIPPVPPRNPIRTGCNIVGFISELMFIISGIMILYKKIKSKKQYKKIKVSKKIKIIFIISIILFILSEIGIQIVNSLEL